MRLVFVTTTGAFASTGTHSTAVTITSLIANFIGGNEARDRDGGGVRAGRGKRSGRSHKLILHLELVFAGRVVCLQRGGEASGRSPGPNVCAAIHVQAEQQFGGLSRSPGSPGAVGRGAELIVARRLIEGRHSSDAAVFRHHRRGRFFSRKGDGNNGRRTAGDVRSAPDTQAVRGTGEADIFDIGVAQRVGDGGDRHVVICL